MRLRTALFYLLLLLQVLCIAQQTFKFNNYTSANGLSQNSGYCMVQDGIGYLWMGTQDGLNRFNGKEMYTFYKESIHRGQLTDNFIKTIFFDSLNNRLWIGTASGLCMYDYATDSFLAASRYLKGADTLNGIMIRSIVKGRSASEVIVLTNSEGMFVCNSNSGHCRQYFYNAENKNNTSAAVVWHKQIMVVSNQSIYAIDQQVKLLTSDPQLQDVRQLFVWKNQLWAASTIRGALYLPDVASSSLQHFECGSNNIGCFETDAANNLWIGTRNNGLVIIEPSNNRTLLSFAEAPNQNEWPKKFTLSLLRDRQANMWVGSSGGGFAVKTSTKKEFTLLQKKEAVYGKAAHNMILGIFKPAAKLLYAGTQLEGLRKINLATGQIATIANPDPSGNSVYSLCGGNENNLWLATAAGLFELSLNSNRFTKYTDSLPQASGFGEYVTRLSKHDSLLYSSNRGIIFFDLKQRKFKPFTYTASSGKPLHIISHKVLEDDIGNLWIGANGLGLLHYDVKTGFIKVIEAIRSFSQTVNSMYLDGQKLWLTTNNGLACFNASSGLIEFRFTVANGLPGNVLYSIEKDRQGNFWCGSNVGLIKLNPYTRSITQVKASAGLQADEFNTACSATDVDGNLYFGGIDGITVFNPSNFTIDQFSPSPIIESIAVDNKQLELEAALPITTAIEVQHQQNSITLEFGVLNFINHEECLYRYKLEGADADWINCGSRSFVNYTGLKPGNYVFRLQSSNSNGVWSPGITSLAIRVLPAWWQTWWCYLVVAVATALVVFLIIRKRISDIHYRAATRQKITETEMAALKAQMNPHFMFNCINSIDAFIHSNDKYNATLYLNKFAKMLRNILDSSKHNVVPLSKDIDTLQLYIELEELRHENKFTTTMEVENELLSSDYKVPPLIIQPFVENAILHGLKNLPGNTGKLHISVRKWNDDIEYTIEDNGIGRAAARQIVQNKESSYGMDMSMERIKLFNKENAASIIIRDNYNGDQPTGTTIIVKLKMQ